MKDILDDQLSDISPKENFMSDEPGQKLALSPVSN